MGWVRIERLRERGGAEIGLDVGDALGDMLRARLGDAEYFSGDTFTIDGMKIKHYVSNPRSERVATASVDGLVVAAWRGMDGASDCPLFSLVSEHLASAVAKQEAQERYASIARINGAVDMIRRRMTNSGATNENL